MNNGRSTGYTSSRSPRYLHRVPPRIQAALLGNVDVWLLFSLGVEDMDDAWKIVSGESHGWTPQDLVDGLRPHEVALATSGGLVKLETRPSPAPAANAADLGAAVVASSRRYAQPEDSEASPWLVDQDDLETVLNGLAHRSRTLDELGGITSLRSDKIVAALRRLEEAGDVERNAEGGQLGLTPRGNVHLRALLARGTKGRTTSRPSSTSACSSTPVASLRRFPNRSRGSSCPTRSSATGTRSTTSRSSAPRSRRPRSRSSGTSGRRGRRGIAC